MRSVYLWLLPFLLFLPACKFSFGGDDGPGASVEPQGVRARACAPDDVKVTWSTSAKTTGSIAAAVSGATWSCTENTASQSHYYGSLLTCSADPLQYNQSSVRSFLDVDGTVSVSNSDGSSQAITTSLAFPKMAALVVTTDVTANACNHAPLSTTYREGYDLEGDRAVDSSSADIYLSYTNDSNGIATIDLVAPFGIKQLSNTRLCDVDMDPNSESYATSIAIYRGGSLIALNGVNGPGAFQLPTDWRSLTFLVRTRSGRLAKLSQVSNVTDSQLTGGGCIWTDCGGFCNNPNYVGANAFRFSWFLADEDDKFSQ